MVSALLVRIPALGSRGRPPDFTAPSPNTVSRALQLQRWSWGTWSSPRHSGTGPGPMGLAAMLFCPGGSPGGALRGVLGSFSPPSPGSTPGSASPTLPNLGLLSAQPKLQQRWPRMGAWPSGRKGGQAVGFPPAAGEPERVHQQACSHGEENTC